MIYGFAAYVVFVAAIRKPLLQKQIDRLFFEDFKALRLTIDAGH